MNTVLVKYAFRSIDPLAFTGLRFVAMTPLAFLLARAMHQQIRFQLRDLPMLIACGACGYGLYQYFWVLGLANTTAFASSLLASLSPMLTLTIVAFSGEERVRSGRWLGAAIALFGVAIFEGVFAGHLTFRPGDALTFCAAIVFAIFNVLSGRLVGRYTPVGLVAVTMAIGTLILLPGALPRMVHQNYAALPASDWWIFAYSVVFPIVLTFPVCELGNFSPRRGTRIVVPVYGSGLGRAAFDCDLAQPHRNPPNRGDGRLHRRHGDLPGDGKNLANPNLDRTNRPAEMTNKRFWYLLLLLPFVATLIPPLYAHASPSFFGFPFFYWYQILWIVLSALIVWIVFKATRGRAP